MVRRGPTRSQRADATAGILDCGLRDTGVQRGADGEDRLVRAVLQQFSPAQLRKNMRCWRVLAICFRVRWVWAPAYYSYKWAEVLDADAFTRFQAEGIFSPVVWGGVSHEILAKGNSRGPEDLYRNFMGRDPDPAALLANRPCS